MTIAEVALAIGGPLAALAIAGIARWGWRRFSLSVARRWQIWRENGARRCQACHHKKHNHLPESEPLSESSRRAVCGVCGCRTAYFVTDWAFGGTGGVGASPSVLLRRPRAEALATRLARLGCAGHKEIELWLMYRLR